MGISRSLGALLLVLALFSAYATEPEKHFLRTNSPEILYRSISVEDLCSVSADKVVETVDGSLFRARLKTGDYFESIEELGLYVDVSCLRPAGIQIYKIQVQFVRGSTELDSFILYPPEYGSFGKGGTDQILADLKESVDLALTYYLTTNFNLAPD